MKRHFTAVLLALMATAVLTFAALAQEEKVSEADTADGPGKLAVVWTSGDPDVAHRVCLMYTHATRKAKWFNETMLIVWGPSARLLAADKDLQAKVKTMMEDGIIVKACIVCANSYGVTERLREFGIEVLPMGAPLTRLLKSPEWEVLTF